MGDPRSTSSDHYRPNRVPILSTDGCPAGLEHAVNGLINRLLLIGLVVYPFVLAGSIYRTALHGWGSILALQVGFYLLIVGAHISGRHVRFRTRALGLIAVVFVLGAVGVYQWGLVGMGIPSLFFAVLFTSNLLETRQTYAVLAAAVGVILGVGYGAVHGNLHQDLDVRLYVTSWNGWIVAATHFVLLLLIILTAFRTLYGELIRMFVGAEQRARELEDSRARLAHEVNQRRELEAQFVQAQKMEAVGRLAGGVAHDFNNQLFVITSMAEMLERRMGAGNPHRRDIAVILQSARQSTELTRQLLTFSRRQTIQPRVLRLDEVVRGVERMLRRLVGENVDLRFELNASAELVSVDQGLLEQTIVNLVVNARDAMPSGGSLIIQTSSNTVADGHARARGRVAPGRYVVLAVSDTGTGMSGETVSHIFEPFYTTKAREKGTGLGLASVYGFVKQSGGEVLVDSEEGAGATFTLYFPWFETPDIDEDLHRAPPEIRGGRETILVVEDEEEVGKLLSVMLGQMGYTVIACRDAEEALRDDEGSLDRIDLLLTDLVLPGMTGKGLADRLQERKSGLKAVFMSGYSEDVISQHGVLEVGVHFIQKPFDRATLARKVREALEDGEERGNS